MPESTSTMIRLDDVTKEYPGQAQPAVDHITMDIPEGNIVVFVGTSGCGKTTTLKMINRLIEPSSGRIFLAGEDVTRSDPNLLRRRIGYVIQQIGLFPHLTIADNIAVVPKMLGWDRKRIADRTEVLLDMVGLKMATHGNRYPRQLSGGQQQRVGVARALAADPPVLLMDEPFGATDPITREHLQDELLRIQATVRKTIVFVTHDIDEAIKLGDKIAVLREQSRIAQYGTPDEILSKPADSFVSNFVGVGASLKRLQVVTVGEALARHGDSELTGTGTPEPLATGAGTTINTSETLHSALDKLLTTNSESLPVVDANGLRQGRLTIDTVIKELRATHAAKPDDDDGKGRPA